MARSGRHPLPGSDASSAADAFRRVPLEICPSGDYIEGIATETPMNAIVQFTHEALLPGAERVAIALAVAAVLCIAWLSAEHESRGAVIVAEKAMKAQPLHSTLPTVQVTGRKA